MLIQPIFTGVTKGRQLFSKLSKEEQIAKINTERLRQNFNRKNIGFKLSPSASIDNDLQDYIRFKVSVQNIIKKITEKFI